jgi:hypothetical protein
MSTYRAKFTAQAEVTFEVTVFGDNLNDGIVAAHDAVAGIHPDKAKVTHVVMETLAIAGFDKVEDAPVNTGTARSPVNADSSYQVHTFNGYDCTGTELFSAVTSSYSAAKAILADAVKRDEQSVGSGKILDTNGLELLRVNSERGGWEVAVFETTQDESASTFTWISSQAEALKLAVAQMSKPNLARIHIYDFTDRTTGPNLWKKIG